MKTLEEQDFCNLYPQGNCGLNVHNIGFQYVDYVQLLGPSGHGAVSHLKTAIL